MKKLILLTITIIIMVGCDDVKKFANQPRKQIPDTIIEWHNSTVIIDSCEYIVEDMRGLVEHKGNCRFCQERMRKMIKEINND